MGLRHAPARGASVLISSSSRGPQGNTGTAATVAVGTVTELAPGETPTVANAGTSAAASLNFGLPGTPTIEVGTVTTVLPGAPATVTNSGTAAAIVLEFEIPAGEDGEMAGPGASIDSEIALYSGTGGVTLKRATTTGMLKATSGVLAAAVDKTDYIAPATLAAATTGNGASLVGIEDSGGLISATTVEGAIAENRTAIDAIEADYLVSGDIGSTVQGYDADTLKADTADVLTAGFAATVHNAGTKSTGTFTPDEASGNMQNAVNGGAHTLAPPTNNCTLVIQYTNNASAGTITTSGFTVVDGDSLTTTNGHDFFLFVVKCNGFSSLTVKALQ